MPISSGISNFLEMSFSTRLAKPDLWQRSKGSVFAVFCVAPIDKAPKPVCQSLVGTEGETGISQRCLDGNRHAGWQGHVVP